MAAARWVVCGQGAFRSRGRTSRPAQHPRVDPGPAPRSQSCLWRCPLKEMGGLRSRLQGHSHSLGIPSQTLPSCTQLPRTLDLEAWSLDQQLQCHEGLIRNAHSQVSGPSAGGRGGGAEMGCTLPPTPHVVTVSPGGDSYTMEMANTTNQYLFFFWRTLSSTALGRLQRGRGSPAVCDAHAHSGLRTAVLVGQRPWNHGRGL